MTTTKRYCNTCQAQFTVAIDRQVCPQCRQSLESEGHERTVDFDEPRCQSAAADGGEDDFVGSHFDKYHIARFLGKGGMGRVYLAQHLALERPCALKILRPAKVERDAEAVVAFLAEARAAAALVHPHVVTIHTIGEEHGRHFIEMEYIEGRSLAHVVSAAGRLDALAATKFMLQISSALAAAHELGMVHRDIKPANVMVTRDQDAKLADFGLAKRLASGKDPAQTISGTPSYMAPELFAGERARKQSDIYAMGVTFFSLLTGELPVRATSIRDLIKYHAKQQPPDVLSLRSDLSTQVADVVRTCLAKDPRDRFEDSTVLHEALRAVFGTLRSLKSLLEEALAGEPVEIEGGGDRLLVRVCLLDGRSQNVIVESMYNDEISETIIRIYSVAGPVGTYDYERALQLNSIIPHGALAIDTIDGQPHFVMINTYPRATCDAEEVCQSVMSIAARTDEIEHRLVGKDRH